MQKFKVLGVLVAVALVVAGAVAPVNAASVEELQAMIASLQAQIASLSGGSSSASSGYMFNSDLTIGSSGADVVQLQTVLEQGGYLVMPAGVAKGYFGALTQSAVAKWQAAMGIAPASGYFGPISRAKMNSSSSSSSGSSSNDDDSSADLAGDEADFKDFEVLGSPSNEDVNEGATEEVFGVKFEADQGDLMIERLDLIFQNDETSSAQDKPWKVLDEVIISVDGDEIASVAVDSDDDWSEVSTDIVSNGNSNQAYKLRISGLDEIVKEGDEVELMVSVTVTDSADSNDLGETWGVALADNGIRAIDGAGIDQYAGNDGDEVYFDVQDATTDAELKVSRSTDDQDDRVESVDDTSKTNDVELLVFELEAKESDIFVEDIDILLSVVSTSTYATEVDDIVSSLTLELDGDEIGSESVAAGAGISKTVTFDDLDFTIEEGEEVTLVVKADIEQLDSTNFIDGDAITADVVVSATGIDAEDQTGDALSSGNYSGSAEGKQVTFYETGIEVEYLSSEESKTSVDNSSDTGTYEIVFSVTAFGNDVYIVNTTTNDNTPTSLAAATGVNYSITNNSTVTGISGTLAQEDSDSDAETYSFKIAEGDTAEFRLTVGATATSSTAFHRVALEGVEWALTDTSTGSMFKSNLGVDADTKDLQLIVR